MVDEVTKRAIRDGGVRPLYAATSAIAREDEAARQAVLATRTSGDTTPLDPELFPPDVFNADGTRKRYRPTEIYPAGQFKQTPAEQRAQFEWEDSKGM